MEGGAKLLTLGLFSKYINPILIQKGFLIKMSPKESTTSGKTAPAFSDEERAAMKERAEELKAAARGGKVESEAAVLAKITEMPEPDRSMAMRLHTLIKEHAPSLTPRLWYGMPAYAREGKVVCFFQSGQKFKTRYATLGFSDAAHLDEGNFWPTSFALKELTAVEEESIIALIKRAVG